MTQVVEGLPSKYQVKFNPQNSRKRKKYWGTWWFTSIIPALGRLRQEDLEFKVSLDYPTRPCPKKQKE
jgi:hypothetical protein